MIVPVVRVCVDCGERIINPGAHWERCIGPPKRACECPPGFRHQRGCSEAYWPVRGRGGEKEDA